MSGALVPLRERNFRYYWLSRLVDGAGTTMAGVALAFAVLEVSDSAAALGTVLAAYSIPMVVCGVLADRFGRTLVIQASNVVSGLSQLATAALVISGTAEVWQLAVLAALNGTASAVGMPALAGVLPQLVLDCADSCPAPGSTTGEGRWPSATGTLPWRRARLSRIRPGHAALQPTE